MYRLRKTTKSLVACNRSSQAMPHPGIFSLWSKTQKNTPRRAVGDMLNLIRMVSPPRIQHSPPASPVTRMSKLAILSSHIMHLNSDNHTSSFYHDMGMAHYS